MAKRARKITQREMRAARLDAMPQEFHGDYQTAMKGRDVQAAVRAFCGGCTGWPTGPETCDDAGCPLWRYRTTNSKRG